MKITGYYPLSAYYPLIEILVCAFNAILFILLSYLCLRDYDKRRTRWGGRLYAYVVVACAVLFVVHLGNDLASEFFRRRFAIFDLLEIAAKYLVPPLAFHLFYRDVKEHLRAQAAWYACIVATYVAAPLFAAVEFNAGVVQWSGGWPGWGVARLLFRVIMTAAAAGSISALWTARPSNTLPLAQARRRWLLSVSGAWAGLFILEALLPQGLNDILEKLIPLCFIFIVTYYVERFTFFDIVIKRGAFVFASLFLLALYFVLIPPILLSLKFHSWVGTMIWALTAWPIVLLAPWGHRRLSSWIDRHFLGRRFSPAEATKYFLAGLQGIIDDDSLAQEAEARLTTIFKSKADVILCHPPTQTPGPSEGFITTPIRLNGEPIGEIRVQALEQHARFLSEDMLLLASLADGLAFLLENLRLREKRLEQERREQELLLNANRSELKALRAQINPHFLFNALNTIASLIPRHPERAEETIEELAEVFRYTLRRSDREWVRLDEELDAVRAYLHIEQARFGQSLQFEVTTSGPTEGVRIPAMIIQTLVENSIKHGIAKLTTPGIIEVRVDSLQSDLRIEVRDNGPGFEGSAIPRSSQSGGGFGLRNVRDRLRGYFGEMSQVTVGRDAESGMTLVAIDLPRSAQPVGAAST